jgi:hypothetical protein
VWLDHAESLLYVRAVPRLLIRKGAAMSVPTTMKATVLVAPHRFEVLERPVPSLGDEDVLVRVRACGI